MKTVLMEMCCSTLESLKIDFEPFGTVVRNLHISVLMTYFCSQGSRGLCPNP